MPYTVVCEDGRVRHPQPFDHKENATFFAEWGHCCTNRHTIFGGALKVTERRLSENGNGATRKQHQHLLRQIAGEGE